MNTKIYDSDSVYKWNVKTLVIGMLAHVNWVLVSLTRSGDICKKLDKYSDFTHVEVDAYSKVTYTMLMNQGAIWTYLYLIRPSINGNMTFFMSKVFIRKQDFINIREYIYSVDDTHKCRWIHQIFPKPSLKKSGGGGRGSSTEWISTDHKVEYKGKVRRVWRSASDDGVIAIKRLVKAHNGDRMYRIEMLSTHSS